MQISACMNVGACASFCAMVCCATLGEQTQRKPMKWRGLEIGALHDVCNQSHDCSVTLMLVC